MIIPMRKYEFALHHRSYRQFLDDLQELGIVHVVESKDKIRSQETENLTNEAAGINKTLDQLKPFRKENQTAKTPDLTPLDVVEQTAELVKKLEVDRSRLEQLKNAADSRNAWGNYSDKLVSDLEEAGIAVHFYSVSAKKFKKEWLENYPVEIINQTEREIKFIAFGHPEQTFEGSHPEQPPRQQATELLQQVQSLETEEQKIKSLLEKMATDHWQLLQSRLEAINVRVQWLNVWNNPTAQVGQGTIRLLESWVPATEEEKLKRYLEENGIFYIQSPASPGEKPPIYLHNNKFGKLFEPIAKLFSLPAYEELDLTIYFAPFFMLFFGFCLGDAGYGLVLLLGSTIFKRFASLEIKGFLTLGQLFGASTLIMGLIFGTFFGIELAKVPALENIRELFLNSEQVFSLALAVGAIQIIFGIILRVKNQLKQTYPLQALSSVGWLLLFFTAGLFEFLLKGPALSPILKMTETGLFILAGLLILFFSGTGPIHIRMIGGIWEMYNTVTGIFGDLLSYIRLFALGIASSILGLVINQMAVSFGQAPYIGPVIFFLIIVVGHTANIAISSLGAFVHPMRLTFVEFYKNAGFKGGGKPYQPFAKQKNKLST